MPVIVPDLSFLPPELAEILRSINIDGVTVSTEFFPGYKFEKHEMEKAIDKFRPDIRSYQSSQNRYFAWEICVSHEIEVGKREHFTNNSVQYIELRPVSLSSSRYTFYLESLNGFDLVSNCSEFYSLFFQRYKNELNSAFLETLTNSHQQKLKAEALEGARAQARAELKQACHPLRIAGVVESYADRFKLTEKMRQRETLTLLADDSEQNIEHEPKVIPYDYVEFSKFGKADYLSIRINQKYFLASPIRLFSGLIKGLSKCFELTALLNPEGKVVGFELDIGSNTSDQRLKEQILLANESSAGAVNVIDILGRRSQNDRAYCMALSDTGDEFFVSSYQRLLFELLKLLKRVFKCSILLGKNQKGYDAVTGLRLHEVNCPKEINRQIIEFCASVLEELMK
ncbi:MAG: hypothetical protein GQF41_2368 [Candidatus Rifleibacterium amylolyticum]|nr:MAG: hypothetical protein GQF41_2368 [Candidatus Rifleibacterium amylolyticum]